MSQRVVAMQAKVSGNSSDANGSGCVAVKGIVPAGVATFFYQEGILPEGATASVPCKATPGQQKFARPKGRSERKALKAQALHKGVVVSPLAEPVIL